MDPPMHHFSKKCTSGAGAAVMGRSPLIEIIAIVNLHADFWIMGSCEPYVEAWADGPITLYVGACVIVAFPPNVVMPSFDSMLNAPPRHPLPHPHPRQSKQAGTAAM